jgi:hypothetical protein
MGVVVMETGVILNAKGCEWRGRGPAPKFLGIPAF